MPLLRKKSDLLARFEEALRLSGWSFLCMSTKTHPAYYKIYNAAVKYDVKLYIWNITPGGRSAYLPHEYRIQKTGISEFEPEAKKLNLILGWWEDIGVFAGWDVRRHIGTDSGSPSLQVDDRVCHKALLTGFAPYVKANGETVIAIRPDFMGTYIDYMEALHDTGAVPTEARILSKLSDDPEDVDDDEIDEDIDETRKFAVLETRRALRALDFSARVLSAYGHSCAMCGVQLRLIDGAHILPVVHPDSTDRTSNGVALCSLHHRAYDRGLVTFDTKYKVHISKERLKFLRDADRIEGVNKFKTDLRSVIIIPADKRDRPSGPYVQKANALRGWILK